MTLVELFSNFPFPFVSQLQAHVYPPGFPQMLMAYRPGRESSGSSMRNIGDDSHQALNLTDEETGIQEESLPERTFLSRCPAFCPLHWPLLKYKVCLVEELSEELGFCAIYPMELLELNTQPTATILWNI